MYPVNLGAKGMWVINYLNAAPIFDKHLNQYYGIMQGKKWIPWKEPRYTYMSTHLEV